MYQKSCLAIDTEKRRFETATVLGILPAIDNHGTNYIGPRGKRLYAIVHSNPSLTVRDKSCS